MRLRSCKTRPVIIRAVVALILTFSPALSLADGSEQHSTKQSEPIRISADSLTINGNENWAEFKGNVKVVQGKTNIAAQRLRIYYKSKGETEQPANTGRQDSLEKIVAYGNVRINMDNRVAVTPKAVYSTADQILVLEGAGSRLKSGRDTIVGDKITFFRRQGRIKVTGLTGKQVRAVIYSDKKVLD